jgi:aspartate aminotransferase
MDSLSKTYGMPGWRVGFVAGPEAGVKALVTLNSNHITCLPEITETAAIAALTGPQDIPAAKREDFSKRRDEVVNALLAIPGVKCPRPQGAFYAFPDISVAFGKSHNGKPIENDIDFCKALLEDKFVATVPGSAFGAPRSLRISYTCAPEQLQKGLARIQSFFAELSDEQVERVRAAGA